MFKKKVMTLAITTACTFVAGCAISPEPYDYEEILEIAESDSELIYQSQQSLGGELTLSEVMARAVKYNLENRMQLMAEALSDSSYELVKMDMLPILAASAGYFDRSNVDASRSYNIITETDNFSYSTSQDQTYTSTDVRFAWNILDFGVSYLQAKQEGDRFLVSGLARRKVMLRLLEQARGAYWRAAAMQSITGELDELMAESKQALERLERVRDEQLADPMITLQDTRALIELVQQLEEIEQTANMATIELATLINEKPGSSIRVQLSETLPEIPEITADLESLELAAIANSSDYVGEIYNLRVDQLESRKAMLRLLPGLEFSYGANYHTNSYMYNDNWGLLGVRLTGNLMRLVARGDIKDQNEAREQLALTRRLNMNMAVMTQVHLSWQQYTNMQSKLERAEQLDTVDTDISVLSAQSRASNATSGIAQLQTEARALRSKMAKLTSYADVQSSYASFLTSLSVDPVPTDYQLLGVDELAERIDLSYENWMSERLPQMSAYIEDSQPVGITALVNYAANFSASEAVKNNTAVSDEPALTEFVEQWIGSRVKKDLATYLSHYHTSFKPAGGLTRAQWQQDRRRVLSNAEAIDIRHEAIEVVKSDGKDALVRFKMHYASAGYSDETEKELDLVKDNGQWRIVNERNLEVKFLNASR